MKKLLILFFCCSVFAFSTGTAAGNQKNAKRHLWGSIASENYGELTDIENLKENYSKLLLSWRMLPDDTDKTAFDIYHKKGAEWRKINTQPIVNSTNFQVPDNHIDYSTDNTYKLCYHGSDETLDTYTMSAEQVKNKKPYISIFLKETASDKRINDAEEYIINDGGVADLDGDGEYEILVVRHARGYKNETLPQSRAILEAYKLDGTFLWRVIFGYNIPHNNACVFIAADFNGDGKDEIAIRTSEGTYFGDGRYIADTNGDGKTNYAKAGLYNRETPEFVSIIDGMTGSELARAPYITLGTSEEWGDNYYKRANSMKLAGAKLKPGNNWQIVACRGIYGKIVMEAWEFNGTGKEMTKLWRFDTDANNKQYKDYSGQGNHQLAVADVDGDGFDEITYGACAIDHDGTGLYTTKLGHGDMLHLGKFDPNRQGLQVYQCFESGLTRSSLRDAHTGEQIWALVGDTPGDEGRSLIADIDPESPGCEAWVYDRIVYDINGKPTGAEKATMVNFPIWWTGSLNRQLFDNRTINQYNRNGGNVCVFDMKPFDVACANGSKNNVAFMGDILGDWREEVIIARRHSSGVEYNKRPLPGSIELMIFSTWYPTEYKYPYLMSDDVYYRAAIHQNVGYNSPNHLGYYLGSDLIKK
ncbi:MAG: hypothetical protein ACLT4H_00090 [Bacteroides thetaiotaomicron]